MNYSFSKRNSRLLTILMVLAMLMTMFTGCLGSGSSDETTGSTEGNVPPGLVEVKPTDETTEPAETNPVLDENAATVTGDQVNVRSSPSTNAKVIGYLEKGTVVEVDRTDTSLGINWALIRYGTTTGWVAADYLDFNYEPDFNDTSTQANPDGTQPDETTPSTTTSIKGVITASELNIRKEADASSDVTGNYVKGDVVTILETKNGWGRTSQGWISMTYVNTNGETTNNNNSDDNNTTSNNTTNTTNLKGVVTVNELNIRKEASATSDRVGSYTYGDRVTILETTNGWGRTDKGWISLNYVYQDGTTGTNTAKGIVTGNGLNVRSGPGTNYDGVGSLNYGARVNILEQITVNGATWACTKDGWISMAYVYVDGTTGEGSGTGTVTGDQVNIRSGPGTTYGSNGTLNKGDTVKILAQFEIGGMTWGCTEKGWVCMDYVEMD